MPEDHETRTLLAPRTGTKICMLIALPLLLAAAYFFWVPVTLQSPENGATFNCGSAANAPSDAFASGTCGDLNKVNRFRAIGFGAAALLIGGAGAGLFGVDRREERRLHRGPRHDDRRGPGGRRERDREGDREGDRYGRGGRRWDDLDDSGRDPRDDRGGDDHGRDDYDWADSGDRDREYRAMQRSSSVDGAVEDEHNVDEAGGHHGAQRDDYPGQRNNRRDDRDLERDLDRDERPRGGSSRAG